MGARAPTAPPVPSPLIQPVAINSKSLALHVHVIMIEQMEVALATWSTFLNAANIANY